MVIFKWFVNKSCLINNNSVIILAEGFYRAQDESDDCVIDVADENEIYILDETTSGIE